MVGMKQLLETKEYNSMPNKVRRMVLNIFRILPLPFIKRWNMMNQNENNYIYLEDNNNE